MEPDDPSGGTRPGWVPPPDPTTAAPQPGSWPPAPGSWPQAGPWGAAPGGWPQPWSPPPAPNKKFGWGGLIGAFFIGVVATVVGGFVLLILIGLALGDDFDSGFFETTTHTYVSAEADVPEVGDCLGADPDTADITTEADIVDCDESHGAEVAAVVDAPGGEARPSSEDLDLYADDACLLAFEAYVGSDWDESDLDYGAQIPDADAWRRGDRTVWCLIDTTDGFGEDGTVRNSHR